MTAPPTAEAMSEAITEIWCRVLGTSAPSDEDFFALGGTSRDAMTLMMLVEDRLDVGFPLETFMVDSRLATLIEGCTAQWRGEGGD